MDRRRTERGPEKPVATAKERAGHMVGNRHPETERKEGKPGDVIRSGTGRALDAVREVVQSESEGKLGATKAGTRDSGKEMEAVRQIVEKE